MRDGEHYCLPVLSEEDDMNFAACVGFSNKSIADAGLQCMDAIGEVRAYKMKYDPQAFEKVEETISELRKIGVDLS